MKFIRLWNRYANPSINSSSRKFGYEYIIEHTNPLIIDEAIARLQSKNLDLGNCPDYSVKYGNRRAKFSDIIHRKAPCRICFVGPGGDTTAKALSLLDDEIAEVTIEYQRNANFSY
jgi:hypothetical protein